MLFFVLAKFKNPTFIIGRKLQIWHSGDLRVISAQHEYHFIIKDWNVNQSYPLSPTQIVLHFR